MLSASELHGLFKEKHSLWGTKVYIIAYIEVCVTIKFTFVMRSYKRVNTKQKIPMHLSLNFINSYSLRKRNHKYTLQKTNDI